MVKTLFNLNKELRPEVRKYPCEFVMESTFEAQIRVGIERLKEDNFQKFINFLFGLKYDHDYLPIKKERDKGCDGILNRDTILSIYAPQKENLNSFKKKIGDDYFKYQKNWGDKYPKWCVVYNGELTADRTKYILSLKGDAKPLSIQHVMKLIFSEKWHIRREVAKYLGVSEEFFSIDIMKKVIEDMMCTEFSYEDVSSQPPYVPKKIEINYSKEDVEGVTREYEELIPDIRKLGRLLHYYSSEEIRTLKVRVLKNYNMLSGDFKSRFERLTNLFSEKYPSDDIYRFYVIVVLYYCFEICLIGQRVEGEQ